MLRLHSIEFNVNYVNNYVEIVDYFEPKGDLFRLSEKDGKFSFGFEVDHYDVLWTGVIEYTVDPADNSVAGTLKNGKTRGDGWSCELLNTKVSGYTEEGPSDFEGVTSGTNGFTIETTQGDFVVKNAKASFGSISGTEGIIITGKISSSDSDFSGEIKIGFLEQSGTYYCKGPNDGSVIWVYEDGLVYEGYEVYWADEDGGSCNLNVTVENNRVKGNFTATFAYDEDDNYQPVTVTKAAEFNLPLN